MHFFNTLILSSLSWVSYFLGIGKPYAKHCSTPEAFVFGKWNFKGEKKKKKKSPYKMEVDSHIGKGWGSPFTTNELMRMN